MILYHGTNHAFDKIDLLKSKPNKDFGRGFYLSPNYEQALNMANVKREQLQDGEPIVITYEVDDKWDFEYRIIYYYYTNKLYKILNQWL